MTTKKNCSKKFEIKCGEVEKSHGMTISTVAENTIILALFIIRSSKNLINVHINQKVTLKTQNNHRLKKTTTLIIRFNALSTTSLLKNLIFKKKCFDITFRMFLNSGRHNRRHFFLRKTLFGLIFDHGNYCLLFSFYVLPG